ncbi:predicted protein [Plenodomus lingam JN3]|uniref:Predicted protein n=1 Tax=Leptosphaeria maculans (strain JN3 / isolate v23.1.3 / race Av1-4-5-6-7-8) TaxID=985895 RepID=E4ZI15_LEPMJ|nr:predicted protein [Plenodomus lingam JN3]CBX91158.1 predicted protein [Plenodomus lingam JN3]
MNDVTTKVPGYDGAPWLIERVCGQQPIHVDGEMLQPSEMKGPCPTWHKRLPSFESFAAQGGGPGLLPLAMGWLCIPRKCRQWGPNIENWSMCCRQHTTHASIKPTDSVSSPTNGPQPKHTVVSLSPAPVISQPVRIGLM